MLSDLDYKILKESMSYVDEVLVEERKGSPQSYYVGVVESGEYWDGKSYREIPDHLVGYYRMEYCMNLSYLSFGDALNEYTEDFVKCSPVKVEITEWEIDET